MTQHTVIQEVDDTTIGDLLATERGALILSSSTCGACWRYQQEIVRLRQQGQLAGLVIGKLLLDRPGSVRVQQQNPWLQEVSHLPHTVLYRQGVVVDAFSASRATYLVEQVEATL